MFAQLLLIDNTLTCFVHIASNNGHTQLLLCLHGTIPITYRSIPYNIPVAFWIPKEYPKIAPIPYVKPTANMLIREGRHVDKSGMCYHQYRSNWSSDPVSFLSIFLIINALKIIRNTRFWNLLLFYSKSLHRNHQFIPNQQIIQWVHHKFNTKSRFWIEYHLLCIDNLYQHNLYISVVQLYQIHLQKSIDGWVKVQHYTT